MAKTDPIPAFASIREKYGGKRREAINKAIRAECVGGSEALDALAVTNRMAELFGWEADDGGPSAAKSCYVAVLDIIDSLEDDVRERWGLPDRPERDDLRRKG
jgi:hypothetical protein